MIVIKNQKTNLKWTITNKQTNKKELLILKSDHFKILFRPSNLN